MLEKLEHLQMVRIKLLVRPLFNIVMEIHLQFDDICCVIQFHDIWSGENIFVNKNFIYAQRCNVIKMHIWFSDDIYFTMTMLHCRQKILHFCVRGMIHSVPYRYCTLVFDFYQCNFTSFLLIFLNSKISGISH